MNIYESIIDGAQALPLSERGRLYAAVLEYLRFQREPEGLKGSAQGMFTMIRPVLDKQLSQSANASKPRKNQTPAKTEPNASQSLANCEPTASQSLAKTEPNANNQDSVFIHPTSNSLSLSNSEKKAKRFKPPSQEEVDAYIQERGYTGFTGEEFCDFYASKGWKVGGQEMKDWKAAVRTWAHRKNPALKEEKTYAAYD